MGGALAAGHSSFRLEADGPDPVAERPESVVSGRTIEELEE